MAPFLLIMIYKKHDFMKHKYDSKVVTIDQIPVGLKDFANRD